MGAVGADNSRASDARALDASRRGGVWLLVGVAVAGVAAAVGTVSLEEAVGQPEDPARVMLVLQTQDRDAAELVRRGGFEVEANTLEGWRVAAIDALESDALEGLSLPQQVVRLADERGVGHVVFEMPVELEAAGFDPREGPPREMEPAWVAVAVGDFSQLDEDHSIFSYGARASGVVVAEGIGALEALYAQPRLRPDREALTHNPSLEEIQLQERLEDGLHMVERTASLDELATRVYGDVDARLREEGVAVVEIPPTEDGAGWSGGIVPLAAGGALLVSRSVSLKSFDAISLDYALGNALVLHRWQGEPAALVTEFAVNAKPYLRVAERGDAWLVDTRFDAPRIWGLEPSPEAAGEGPPAAPRIVERGELPALRADETDAGEPRADGKLARVASDGGSSWVRIYAPGTDAPLVEFPPLPDYALEDLRWLDAQTVVARARAQSSTGDDLVVFGRLDASERWWSWTPPEHWRNENAPPYRVRISQLAVSVAPTLEIDGARARRDLVLVLERPGGGSWLIHLDASQGLDATRTVTAMGTHPVAPEMTELRREGRARQIGVWSDLEGNALRVAWVEDTPTGSRIANMYCWPPIDEEGRDEPAPRWGCDPAELSSGSEVRDAAPRVLADGKTVVFSTQVPVSVTERKVTRARYVALE